MKLSKKQLDFVEFLEKSGGLFANQIDYSKYPESMIDILKNKGLISEFKNVITSTTKEESL